MAKKASVDIEHRCQHCGRIVRGPGFFRHEESCAKRSPGPSTKLYPIAVPVKLYKGFAEICAKRGESLQEGTVRLIDKEVRLCQRRAEAK